MSPLQRVHKKAMTAFDIPRLRLRNQYLTRPTLRNARDVVKWLCAVQAQDYLAAKWALGSRMRKATDDGIERAFNDGVILRTHVLRPTWHFVLPDDIRWLLALTGPRIEASMAYRRRQLELDSRTLNRAKARLERVLRDGAELTRDELRAVLHESGISTDGQRMAFILMSAELDGIVCSGARRGRQFTYALLDIRAPRGRTLERDEALAELAARYFASRGPATVQDFAKWSGLTVADAMAGLEDVRGDLQSRSVGKSTYWFSPSRPSRPESPSAYLLSIYDEYISGYRDRSAIVAPEHGKKLVGMGNALTSVIVVDGQIVGTWRRVLGPKSVRVETRFFDRPARSSARAVAAETRRYAAFLERPLEGG